MTVQGDMRLENVELPGRKQQSLQKENLKVRIDAVMQMKANRLGCSAGCLQVSRDRERLVLNLIEPVEDMVRGPWNAIALQAHVDLAALQKPLRMCSFLPENCQLSGSADIVGRLGFSDKVWEMHKLTATLRNLSYQAEGVAVQEPVVNLESAGKWWLAEQKGELTQIKLESSALAIQSAKVEVQRGEGPNYVTASASLSGDLSRLHQWTRPTRADMGNVVALDGAKASVLLGNGNGSFQPVVLYATGGTNQCFPIVADFNRDRRLDIATTSCNGSASSVLLGNGNGTFQAPLSYTAGTAAQAIAAGDLNSDRYPELVVTDQASGSALVLLNDADWTSPIPPPGPILLMQDEHHANTGSRSGFESRDDLCHGVDFFVVNAVDELIASPTRWSAPQLRAGAAMSDVDFTSGYAEVEDLLPSALNTSGRSGVWFAGRFQNQRIPQMAKASQNTLPV